jgi:ribosomal protein S8
MQESTIGNVVGLFVEIANNQPGLSNEPKKEITHTEAITQIIDCLGEASYIGSFCVFTQIELDEIQKTLEGSKNEKSILAKLNGLLESSIVFEKNSETISSTLDVMQDVRDFLNDSNEPYNYGPNGIIE